MSVYHGFAFVVIALSVGFGIVLATLVKIQHEERRELYDRIMAGSLGEYKAASNERRNRKKPPHERAVEQWMKREE